MQSGNAEVSIIMPAFNAEKTIKESIESVLQQTFKEWILIVIDDNSSDLTYSIVESYKKIGDSITAPPVISEGSLYLLTENSKVYGFN